MKISLEWLRDYLPGDLTADAAADALTRGGLPVESVEQHGVDTVIDVEVTSNRSDCLSYQGVAHELAALLDRPSTDVHPAAPESAPDVAEVTSVRNEAPDLCPHYTARVLRGVRVGPSPESIARRLSTMGSEAKPVRPINNVVDVTNYVLYETGQPLHAFDFDKLEGGRVVVRRARAGEKLTTIDGKDRALSPDMLVIADAARPVALAGVMGGRDTEVTERTTNVLLESARFDPLSVRRTARALAMGSDSSYRFERGIDPTLPPRASLRAAQLILQTAGGTLLRGLVAAGPTADAPPGPKPLTLRLEKLAAVLGVRWPTARVVDALRRLRLQPVLRGDRVDVTVPPDRLDLNLEIDLVEEVARVVGYDEVPVRDEISIRLTPPDPTAQSFTAVVGALAAAGYDEAVTFSFVSDALAADFIPAGGVHPTEPLPRADHAVRKADGSLRPSILPGLLEAVRRNEAAGVAGAKLFEAGSVFWNDAAGRVQERRRLALVGSPDVREVRGVVEAVLRKLDPSRPVRVVPDPAPGFARGASGRVEWGDAPVGHVGKVARPVADKLALRDAPAAAELDLPALLAGAARTRTVQDPPRFPPVRRDLSLDLPEATRYERVESLVRSVAPPHLESLEYVTTYRGKPLPPGTKSVTVTLVFRSPTDTLTGDQVEAAVQQVVDAAKQQLAATLRS